MIARVPPPAGSLLATLGKQAHKDAFTTVIAMPTDLPTLLRAFYATRLFRVERWALRLAGHPSTDADLDAMAQGERDTFAAWTVADRTPDQILLRAAGGGTHSWLAVQPEAGATRLMFGSAVAGADRLPFAYRATLPLHLAYSRALLSAARRALIPDHS